MTASTSFGQWLRLRRRALDLTQEELARRVACSPVMLRKLESEERPLSQHLMRNRVSCA
jgi:transcriptional regulator with XRE-family HTH domain